MNNMLGLMACGAEPGAAGLLAVVCMAEDTALLCFLIMPRSVAPLVYCCRVWRAYCCKPLIRAEAFDCSPSFELDASCSSDTVASGKRGQSVSYMPLLSLLEMHRVYIDAGT